MISKEQVLKNREKIRLKLEKERKRKEIEAKKKAEEIRLKREKEEGIKEREDLAIKIAKEMKLKGVKTIEGKDGDKGKEGDRGGDGEKGNKGERGERGDKGNTGEKGKDGNNGKDGSSGRNGENGKDADEEKIVKEVLKKIPEQETHFEEIEELQKRLKELKEDIENTPARGKYGLRGIVSLRAGTGITIDETKVGKPILNVTPNAGTVENLSSKCNGSRTVFTTTSNTGIIWLTLNGTMLVEGKEFTRDSATQITLTFAPDTGEELYLKYV